MESHQKNQKQRLNVKTKAQLYECMLRNGWYLPAITSTLLTVKYMLSIKDGAVWCPRYEYLKLRACPRPPLKSLLISELHLELNSFKEKRNTAIDETHQPDVDWLLIALATLNANHRYFAKNYVPSVMETRKIFGNIPDINITEDEDELYIHDDFFDDIPSEILDSKSSKKSIIPMSSQEKNKDNIQSAIKIRSKFRQIKHKLEGFGGFDQIDGEDEQKPEEI